MPQNRSTDNRNSDGDENSNFSEDSSLDYYSDSSVNSVKEMIKSKSIDDLNSSLKNLESSPIKKTKINQKKYSKSKSEEVCKIVKKRIFGICDDPNQNNLNFSLLEKLKFKFAETINIKKKIEILTLFADMKTNEIKKHFDATDYLIMKAKNLCAEKGVLSYPSSIIKRKRLDENVIKKIKDFYESDDVSRIMPGKSDYATIWENGMKLQRQKRLIMGNLKEIFILFKESYSNIAIGFSKFAELRPKQCLLAGATGTHTICLCVAHQNFKLLLDCIKNYKLLQKDVSYRDCLAKIICKSPTENCHLNKCQNCPGVSILMENIKMATEEKNLISLKYRQWVTVRVVRLF